ncbi:hypothetical protein UlMin_011491 [Ulmus minor]
MREFDCDNGFFHILLLCLCLPCQVELAHPCWRVSAPTYSEHACTNSTSNTLLTPNTTYYSNLIFLCRGDITTTTCQDCVSRASREILRRCSLEKQAIIWYDVCLIRYQDRSEFVTTPGIVQSTSLNSSRSVMEIDLFNELLAPMMDSLAIRAARSAIAGFPLCCNGKDGGTALLPSCFARYELFPFYNNTETEALPSPSGKPKSSSATIIAIILPIVLALLLFSIGICFQRSKVKKKSNTFLEDIGGAEIETTESMQFDLKAIEAATNKFSEDNKIGEGGFGDVYQGSLHNGQRITVKRLAGSSGQGAAEFKNEVLLMAKLQHRNLVRLLGFCLEGEEKILIYEYVSNRSLDYYLFDHEKKNQLDWTRRYKIITGIARGIFYPHEDSRLKIIHRDLKSSNILLDNEMNPKISDFGMAKVFIADQTQGNTKRIVGTYGYMSPEYAMHGQFSVKSDVFSFGVLILEILSGKKNNCFYQSHGDGDLLSFAWEHWRNGTPLELLDPTIRHSYSKNEVTRCIHLALLCVQENPALRPAMATILLMLNSYSVTLPLPQYPAFSHRNRTQLGTPTKEPALDQSVSNSESWYVNDESMITAVHPR